MSLCELKLLRVFCLVLVFFLSLPERLIPDEKGKVVIIELQDGRVIIGTIKKIDGKGILLSLLNDKGQVLIPMAQINVRQKGYFNSYWKKGEASRDKTNYISALQIKTKSGHRFVGERVEKPLKGKLSKLSTDSYFFIKSQGRVIEVAYADIETRARVRVPLNEVWSSEEIFDFKYKKFPPDESMPDDYVTFAEMGIKIKAYGRVETMLKKAKEKDEKGTSTDKITELGKQLILGRQVFFLSESKKQARAYSTRRDPLSAMIYIDKQTEAFAASSFKEKQEDGPDVESDLNSLKTEILENIKTQAMEAVFALYKAEVASTLKNYLGQAENLSLKAAKSYATKNKSGLKSEIIGGLAEKVGSKITGELTRQRKVNEAQIRKLSRASGLSLAEATERMTRSYLGTDEEREGKAGEYLEELKIDAKNVEAVVNAGPPKGSWKVSLKGAAAVFYLNSNIRFKVKWLPKSKQPKYKRGTTWWKEVSVPNRIKYLTAYHLEKSFQGIIKKNVCPVCQGKGKVKIKFDQNEAARKKDSKIKKKMVERETTCYNCLGVKSDRLSIEVKQ